MKLWTIQSRKLIETSTGNMLLADWNCTPQNWRFYYRWMAEQWACRVGLAKLDTPFWCWHSCNGQREAPPTVATASALMGDWNYYAASLFALEIAVPDELVLLSSYSRWNAALDDAIDNRSEQIDTRTFSDMFDEPFLKHDLDDIQAVIPFIDRSWITDIRTLPIDDSDWGLSFERFPLAIPATVRSTVNHTGGTK